jgi:metal-responsive CopG/Arc/MetJ family transcriptional regulator
MEEGVLVKITTISIDEELWKRFSLVVIQDVGSRKKSEVIEQFIREYTEKKEKGIFTMNEAGNGSA